MLKYTNILNRNNNLAKLVFTPTIFGAKNFGNKKFSTFEPTKATLDKQSERAQSHIYHRHSTLYSYTPREVLQRIEKDYVEPADYTPVTVGDHFAKYSVKALRKLSNLFFKEKYIHYAIVLETVASIPGAVGGVLLHLKSLRTMERNNWIKVLMDEMENERMHLLSFIEITKPSLTERMMVAAAQAVYWNMFLVFYVLSPGTAHRFVGYLEYQACVTYSNFLADLDAGKVENVKAPQLAIDYWGLPKDATLRDMILVIRQDENDHKMANHEISNKIKLGNNDPVIVENVFHKPVIVNPVLPNINNTVASEPKTATTTTLGTPKLN